MSSGIDIAQAARRLRLLAWVVTAAVGLLLLSLALRWAASNWPAVAAVRAAVDRVDLVVFYVLAACGWLCLVRLRVALGGSWIISSLLGALWIVPLAGLLLSVVVMGRAQRRLKRLGLRVGPLGGVPAEELRKLEPTACSACGYDLTGAPGGHCPECGWAFAWLGGAAVALDLGGEDAKTA